MGALFQIEVNPETSKLVQTLLFKNGFKWAVTTNRIQHTDKQYLYPWDDNSICYGNGFSREYLNLTLDQFIDWINTGKLPAPPEKVIEFRVNDEYTAKITRSKMVVGCQTIPTETALRLAKLIIKVMEE